MTEQSEDEQPHSSDDHSGEEGHHQELGGSSQEEGWYQVIRIVSERKRKSRKEYKVSWALNPKTGKEYPDEWVSDYTSSPSAAQKPHDANRVSSGQRF